MPTPTLALIAPELFQRFEAAGGADRNRIIDDYFVELTKREEMDLGTVEPGYFYALKQIVRQDVVPLYDDYVRKREEIERRQTKRSPVWYVLGTIIGMETLEAILAKGKAFSPPMLVLSFVVEALIGFSIFGLAHLKDHRQISAAKNGLLQSLHHLDQRLIVDKQYASFKEMMGSDDLLRAEALEVIGQYADPNLFWRDYVRVRLADPVNKADCERLGIPAFTSFLKLHASSVYNEQAREHRFNGLFVLAHQAFLERDSEHYALDHLSRRTGALGVASPAEPAAAMPNAPSSTATSIIEPQKPKPQPKQHA
jgi:hypothetical protein